MLDKEPHYDLNSKMLPLSRRTFISWLSLLTASLGLSGLAKAQGSSEDPDQQGDSEAKKSVSEEDSGTVGLGCIGIFVHDLPASLSFYRQLGLAIPEDAGTPYDYRLRLPNGQIFFWETYKAVRAFDPKWQPSLGNRRVVLEFGFATALALDDKYAELTAASYEGYLAPFNFNNGVRYALIRDPDGNEIGLRYPEC